MQRRDEETMAAKPVPDGAGEAADPTLPDLEFVYAFIYRRVGNREDAEDLTHDVAIKVLRRLRRDQPRAAVRAYLVAAARSVLAGFWRQRMSLPVDELRDDQPAARHQPEASTRAAGEVERILSLLPENQRRVLELRFLLGYSTKEVARELGTTVGAVKVTQLRALRAAARLDAERIDSRSPSSPVLVG
jgi:RNA polymerase sigma-70 factor (ECF subfamily)